MKWTGILTIVPILAIATNLSAEVIFDGFLQGLFGGRLDETNPTMTEYTASETRMQLRAQHYGDNGQFFGRLDFVYDGASPDTRYDWELREGYFKFRLGQHFDIKIGRQILTWGTGDLIFINDVFAKDYRSFFVGRDDQYLKAPQNALRIEYYSPLGAFNLVWSPDFEPNRLPEGERLSFYDPMSAMIVGGQEPPAVPQPEPRFENSEVAARFSRVVGGFRATAYFYKGFYKNPVGFDPGAGMPLYPRLNVYGGSIRGQVASGILWLEGGYFDSRDDRHGDDRFMPNSTAKGLFGFERQVANNLTGNVQWQVEYMLDHDIFSGQIPEGGYVRDELYHLLTTRWTKLLNSELVTLSLFGFYSPSDEDAYIRLAASYKYTDEVRLTIGGNIFAGDQEATGFGQFRKNDNAYVKFTYGF